MQKIAIASTNQGKIKEIKLYLKDLDIVFYTQSDFTKEDIEETGTTFLENALLKARFLAKIANMPVIADDSGLCVDALNGAPGVKTARFAGENATHAQNNNKLLNSLKNTKNRAATLVTTLVFIKNPNDKNCLKATGKLTGEITKEPCGKNGFGYDPIFLLPKINKTLAQVSDKEKNSFSHRAKALKKLFIQLNLAL